MDQYKNYTTFAFKIIKRENLYISENLEGSTYIYVSVKNTYTFL